MFHWSKKQVKSVTFNQEVADETLLAVVDSVLEKQPDKTFSDLCKEALWQSLCVPDSVRPGFKTAEMEQQMSELQRQLAGIEQRFFAKEANRLETVERQLGQLTQQVAQLALLVNSRSHSEPPQAFSSPVLESQAPVAAPSSPPTPPQEVDPLLSRLTPFLDDF